MSLYLNIENNLSFIFHPIYRSINTTYITCYSGSAGSDDCLMIVAVEVNNNAFDSSSIFTYKPDPTFTDLDPEITIPA